MIQNISKLKDHFKENQLYLNRTISAIVILMALLLLLIGRVFYLQVYKHDLYVTLATNNQVRLIPTPPTRGLIYDRNGILLAENIPTFSLTIVPQKVKKLKKTINSLSKIIDLSEYDIKLFYKQKKFKGIYENIPIKNKLTEKEVAKFSVKKYKFPGVEVTATLTRKYTMGLPLAHAVGYIGPISHNDLNNLDLSKYRGVHQIGKIGIENFYEEALRGEIGYRHVETDSRGRILRTLRNNPAIPGKNLYLSIDSKLQSYICNLMEDKQGAVVAIEPKTGEILALVSSPSFDPNLFVQGINQKNYDALNLNTKKPLFNRAIKGQYPPGSTIKPIIALNALENKIINKNTIMYDPGFFQINGEGRIFRGWKPNGHGKINLENAIAESCTVCFFQLSNKLGINEIYNTFTNFGLGERSNIDLIGEYKGIAPSSAWKQEIKKEKWFIGETLNVGIGQGYTLATPLQIAKMAATIANKGVKIQPKIVRYMEDNLTKEKQTVEKLSSTLKLKNDNNWDIIISGMHKTTSAKNGTAYKSFSNSRVPVAGKTGTAQVFSYKENQKYEKGKFKKNLRDHSWFMGFAPITNPSIAIAAILEHDETGASDVVKDIIENYLEKD